MGGRQASGSACGANNGQRGLGGPCLVLGQRRSGCLDADCGSRPSTRDLCRGAIVTAEVAIIFGFCGLSGCDNGWSVKHDLGQTPNNFDRNAIVAWKFSPIRNRDDPGVNQKPLAQNGGAVRIPLVEKQVLGLNWCVSARNPIIVALDVPSAGAAWTLAEKLAPVVGAFKIGSELFTSAGPDFVRRIRSTGASVFLDLKFHDIPNTVAKAVASATRLDVQMLTVHTSGGSEMMRAAQQSAQETAGTIGKPVPVVLGVTLLTSMDARTLQEVGGESNIGRQVEQLAALAVKAGLGGLVCSPLEITALRKLLPAQIQLVTPGIRTGTEQADDQKRTLTPKEAMAAGANWIVVGRPIYAAAEPVDAARQILDSLLT